MKTMLKTLVLATGLAGAGPLAYAQEEPTAPNGEGDTMMQEGEGGMMGGMSGDDMSGMMKMMAEMKPMMESCTKMMSAMADNMEKGETPAPKG